MKSKKSAPTPSQEEARRGLERIGDGSTFKALLQWQPSNRQQGAEPSSTTNAQEATSTEHSAQTSAKDSTQASTKTRTSTSTRASTHTRKPDLRSDLIKDELILAPREEKILQAVLELIDEHDRFWCRSTEVMQLSGVKTLRWFFRGMKSLQQRQILNQVAGYRGCHKGTLYQIDRSKIPPGFLPPDSKGASTKASTRDSRETSTETGTRSSTEHSAQAMTQDSPQASSPCNDQDHDLDLKDIDKDIDQISLSTPEIIISEFTKLTGKQWLKSYDRLWQSLTEKPEYKQLGCTPADIVEMMKTAAPRASRVPTTFRFFFISVLKQWQERKRSLLMAFWQDIQAREEITDYSSRVEELKQRLAQLGLSADGQLIDEVTRRRAN